jgi:hypothetical protein
MGVFAIFICRGCSFSSSLESSASVASKFGGSKPGFELSLSSVAGAVVAIVGAAAVVDSVVFLSSTSVLSLVSVNVSVEKHTLVLGGRGGLGLWLACHSVSESGCIILAIWQMV